MMFSCIQTEKLAAYAQLMRLDKPIGSFLLLWPTLWGLWVAAGRTPDFSLIAIFCAGVFVMRSSGCVINDFADRNFDGKVKRTAQRPLARGTVTAKQALGLFLLLMCLALALVLLLNWQSLVVAFFAAGFASLYPFTKRWLNCPQLFLGIAFSSAIPMSFTATLGYIPIEGWLLFLANLIWTIAYDTIYGMVDMDDDIQIGVKSFALALGQKVVPVVFAMQGIALGLISLCYWMIQLPIYSYLFLICAVLNSYYQWRLIQKKSRDAYFKAFLSNNYWGLFIFIGIALGLL